MKQLEWLFNNGKEALDFLVYNEILRQIKVSQNASPLITYKDQKEVAGQQKIIVDDDISSQESDFEFRFETT